MHLLVGLGNPGGEHARNRHNIGFMAADVVARRYGLPAWRSRYHGQVTEGMVGGERTLVLKPTTYMNESGRAVAEAARFHKIDNADVVVMHDELDLAPGKVRAKQGGGTAGHNGLRDIDAHIGNDFWRIRLGIGHPGHKDLVLRWVLGNFAKADETWLEPLFEAVATNLPLLLQGDANAFMSRVAQEAPPPAPASESARGEA